MVQAPTDDPIAPILLRAMRVGALLGSVAVGFAGAAAWSVGLVLYGFIPGAVIGAVVGTANGIGLFLAMNSTQSSMVLRIVAALGSTISACGLLAIVGRLDAGTGLIFVGGCALAGFAVGPFVAYGHRTTVTIPFGKVAVYGGAAGLAVGGLVGLIIGVLTWLPTAPVALVEGGLLGAVPGALLALLVMIPTIWWRRAR